ncbi:Jen1p [Sugiyamaella lignohabitans]|uniref:Jen1p n=1 Tax=Sugiyamaella lignohabitans TaxID=796027 RepID=A0A167CS42_9ASCO|nr:Jen1p [Sugiyamaella lignohabitans]ANB12043.1 Jen1p [Sugiyamaella lignohabitans]
MALMNFNSHGSQDLYPTFLTAQLGFSKNASTVTNCVANIGALVGGVVAGHLSHVIGRRLMILICCVLGGAMVYPWAFSTNNASVNAAVFFMQALGVQSSWGVIPIHLSELSPPRFRAFIVGISYQLGNLASSASSTIESTIGERFPLTGPNGEHVPGKYNYGKVMAIFMGCVFGVLFIVILVGPENRGANLLTRDPDEEIAAAQQAYFQEKNDHQHIEGDAQP